MEVRIAECPLGATCETVRVDAVGTQYIARCPWYTCVRGRDNNTGDEVDEWRCAIAWLPMLTINTANESRQGAAATESFRNEMTKQRDETLKLLDSKT